MSKIVLMTDRDIEKIANGKVVNSKDINLKNNKPYKGGLYDPVIFGALKVCECGRTNVIGRKCSSCRNLVMSTEQYLSTVGYYKLYSPYILYLQLNAFISKLRESIDLSGYGEVKSIQDLWSLYFHFQVVDEKDIENSDINIFKSKDGDFYKVIVSELPAEDNLEIERTGEYSIADAGLFGLIELSTLLTRSGASMSWMDSFIHYNLVIPSIAKRPVSKFMVDGSPLLDIAPLTKEYSLVLDHDKMLPNLIENCYDKLVDKMTLCCFQNVMVDRLTMNNELLQPSKQSLGRNLLETRVARSMRSNVVSNLDLKMDQISIPRSLAYKAIQQDIIEAIKAENIEYTDAIRMYRRQDKLAIDKFEALVNDSMVSMVRNPSLHRHSMQAFYPVLWDEIAIGVSPSICEAYNMDFDGDTVAIQFFLDKVTKAEMQCITPDKMWFYDKRYQSQFEPKHETMYGLHVATKIVESVKLKTFKNLEDAKKQYELGSIEVNETIMIGDKKTTYGREYISTVTNIDLDILLGTDALNMKNVGKLVSAMGYHSNRVDEYKALQDFAELVATSAGLGALPYTDIYTGSEEEVKKILSQTGKNFMEIKAELKDYMKGVIDTNIKNLPDSNMDELLQSVNRIKLDTLVNMHAPYINVQDGVVEVNSDTLATGLSERSYWELAIHDRETLAYKREAVPASGFDQRQLVNAALNLIYKHEINPKPDKVGILVPYKDAIGRFKLDGTKVTSGLKGNVRIRSCINNKESVVYSDEIAIEKFSMETATELKNNPCIGVAFASALTETATQNGLGFKHGGDLESLDDTVVTAVESGEVKDITERFLIIKGDHEYKYLLTKISSIVSNLSIGSFVSKGDVIIKSKKVVKADEQLSKFNTIIDCSVMGTLGRIQNKVTSYAIDDCTIKYNSANKIIDIGSITTNIDENELYYYPEGYKVTKGTCISSGVPNISEYLKITEDVGLVYYIFFNYCTTYIGMFSNFNSEPFEALFKQIMGNNFSVQSTNLNKESLIDRLYYGAATKHIKKDLETKLEETKEGKFQLNIGDSIILPFILNNKT